MLVVPATACKGKSKHARGSYAVDKLEFTERLDTANMNVPHPNKKGKVTIGPDTVSVEVRDSDGELEWRCETKYFWNGSFLTEDGANGTCRHLPDKSSGCYPNAKFQAIRVDDSKSPIELDAIINAGAYNNAGYHCPQGYEGPAVISIKGPMNASG